MMNPAIIGVKNWNTCTMCSQLAIKELFTKGLKKVAKIALGIKATTIAIVAPFNTFRVKEPTVSFVFVSGMIAPPISFYVIFFSKFILLQTTVKVQSFFKALTYTTIIRCYIFN